MNLYVDIDGVLLANEANPAIGAADFIRYISEHFDVYWLTTHCMNGDPAHAIEYVQRAAKEGLRPWLRTFRPTTWSVKKTEAIDFTKPFLWFDDDCYDDEQADLQQHGALASWIQIDLYKNPTQLAKELGVLKRHSITS